MAKGLQRAVIPRSVSVGPLPQIPVPGRLLPLARVPVAGAPASGPNTHKLGAQRTQAFEPPSRPRRIPWRWRRRKETGWDASPKGKGEAGPGRATRDASPASGPPAGGQRPACCTRPTGTSRAGLLLPLLGGGGRRDWAPPPLAPRQESPSTSPVCQKLESGAGSGVTAAGREREPRQTPDPPSTATPYSPVAPTYPPATRRTRGPQLKGLFVVLVVPVPAKLAVSVVSVQKSEASTAAEKPPQSPGERHPGQGRGLRQPWRSSRGSEKLAGLRPESVEGVYEAGESGGGS